ncbi:MAG: ATP-binding protein, partial [Ferruginibacter sp.]
KFMNSRGNINWQQLSNTQSYKAWSGFAFENVCLKHGDKLKEALGIAGVFTEISAFYFKGDRYLDGTQIDLVIDRNDNVINVCEVKFYDKPFTLTKAYAHNLRQKLAIFQEKTKTRKTVFLTLITVFGIIPSMHSTGFVQQEVLSDSLF